MAGSERYQRVRRVVAALTVLVLLPLAPSVADAPPLRIVDVVQVTWPGAAKPSVTAADVARVVQDDTIARWKTMSNGKVIFTFGQVLPNLTSRTAMTCDAQNTANFMDTMSAAAFAQAGITRTDNRYLLLVTPQPAGGCIWSGRGSLGNPTRNRGVIILNDTDDATVIAHELGHNLGLGHSNLERCTGSRRDGSWRDCKAVEYGSATDIMSNNPRTSVLAAYHQWRLGWIPDADVASGNRDTRVTLRAVDALPPEGASIAPFTRAIFLRDGSAAYWVEFRREDPANSIKQGLVLYRTDPPPASAIESPVVSDVSDPLNPNLTTDVWMINLGDYVYGPPAAKGSPSLASDVTFTTAFGGASITARPNADGTADVRITRNGSTVPTTPILTDAAAWRGPATPVLTSDYDDRGVDIAGFDARVTAAGTSRIVRVPSTPSANAERSYLNPIAAPANVRLADLPEGRYSLELRAVNVAGAVSAWSRPAAVYVDLGTPKVTDAFTITAVQPGRSAALSWTGATDDGSGICSAQVLNADGWTVLGWHGDEAGTPSLELAADASVSGDTHVFDCLGNGVQGTLRVRSSFIPATTFARTGKWRSNGASLRCAVGECTARVTSGAGLAALVLTAGTASVSVDGRRIGTVRATATNRGLVQQIAGKRTILVRGKGFTLAGLQQVEPVWTSSGSIAGTTRPVDESLAVPAQRALAGIGFSQHDFADGITVFPMEDGTTTNSPTLDFCGTAYASDRLRQVRRQVVAQRAKDDPYLFLSTETVRYASAAAVTQALAELETRATECRANGGLKATTSSAVQPYTFHVLPTLPAGLVPASTRRIYLVTIGSGEAATTLLAAYQFQGSLLNALYVVKRGTDALPSAEVARWLDVASTLAARLRSAS